MAHQSNAGLVIKAGQQLDEAVKVGKSFAESDPDTLVIVVADHETGSLAIEDTNEIQSDPAYPNESGVGARPKTDRSGWLPPTRGSWLTGRRPTTPQKTCRSRPWGRGRRPGRRVRKHPHTRRDGSGVLRTILGVRLSNGVRFGL